MYLFIMCGVGEEGRGDIGGGSPLYHVGPRLSGLIASTLTHWTIPPALKNDSFSQLWLYL